MELDGRQPLGEIFERAGCRGYVQASTLDGSQELGLASDDPVVPASVIKVLVAIEVETQVADGRLDPAERVHLTTEDRTPGPVGMSLFHDDVEVSLRDLVTMMLTISDNVATDALTARVGLDAVNAAASRLGLKATRVGSDLRTMIESIAIDAGFADYAAMTKEPITEPTKIAALERRLAGASALQPDAPTRTTARDMAQLVRLIWTDQAGPPQACARVRELMGRQLTRHRLAGGFGSGVKVAAKSGGLMGVVRNEVGAVTFDDGTTYVVAVFTRSEPSDTDDRAVNAAIGEAAAGATRRLRDALSN